MVTFIIIIFIIIIKVMITNIIVIEMMIIFIMITLITKATHLPGGACLLKAISEATRLNRAATSGART